MWATLQKNANTGYPIHSQSGATSSKPQLKSGTSEETFAVHKTKHIPTGEQHDNTNILSSGKCNFQQLLQGGIQ